MNLENKKILVAHGDSFTHGIGFPVIDGKSQRVKIEKPWPNLLAKEYGMRCINFGKEGMSNEGIARELLYYLSQTKENFKDLFVVIGWTRYIREEFYNKDNNVWESTTDFSPKTLKDYVTFWKTHENDFKRTMMSKLFIQNYLKLNKISYLFFNTFRDNIRVDKGKLNKKWNPIIRNRDEHSLRDNIMSNAYYPLQDLNDSLLDKKFCSKKIFWNVIEKKMGRDYSFMPDDGHPNERGHEFWANYLKEVISGNKT